MSRFKAIDAGDLTQQAQYQYVKDVLDERVITCELTKLACERSLHDLERAGTPGFGFHYDPEPGDKYRKLMAHLTHLEGPKGGTPIILDPYQVWSMSQILGWKRDNTDLRRFLTAYITKARGNGKTTEVSGMPLYFMSRDNEFGPEIYACATSQQQATILFNKSLQHAQNHEKLMRFLGIRPMAFRLLVEQPMVVNGSKQISRGSFRAVSSDAKRLDGLNVHVAIFDELHAQPNRKLWDVMTTGMGKRSQPLTMIISTAGDSMTNIGFETDRRCEDILRGKIKDDTFFGCIWRMDEGDNPFDEATWRKANPSWDSAIDHNFFRSKAKEAKQVPGFRSAFFTRHLNTWLSSSSQWLNPQDVRAAYEPSLNIEDFKGQPCWIGIDLSKVNDMSAVSVVFERDDELVVFTRYWLPRPTVEESGNALYPEWVRDGHLIAQDSKSVDYGEISQFIIDLDKDYDVQVVGYDKWKADEIVKALEEEMIPTDPVNQGRNLSNANNAFQKRILDGTIKFNNPIFQWNCLNAFASYDHLDNLMISKENDESGNKIDGLAAAINAIHEMIINDTGPVSTEVVW
ncbi:terminase large subunit [Gluconacetobacter sp. 1b LMG 1731]|uniref:Terminase large subunit n=1 Tax=Gluconacetobacter dulcium TaxID=2729096 RepID=A0A7W4NS10_9PROT|nr:terminase TerL endonuclease subunit [Gluconacetobacter dulcium]MBB2164037.1 terminase large subunit [Gluconacetobacter dulcium]MBB2192741.1 terminase large subunit [Gluconacetobacter dulcium]